MNLYAPHPAILNGVGVGTFSITAVLMHVRPVCPDRHVRRFPFIIFWTSYCIGFIFYTWMYNHKIPVKFNFVKIPLLFWELYSFSNQLHGPPMLVYKTNFGLVCYNHANFYRFEKSSIYWSVKRITVFLCFSLVNQRHTCGITVYNLTVTNNTVRAVHSCNSWFLLEKWFPFIIFWKKYYIEFIFYTQVCNRKVQVNFIFG